MGEWKIMIGIYDKFKLPIFPMGMNIPTPHHGNKSQAKYDDKFLGISHAWEKIKTYNKHKNVIFKSTFLGMILQNLKQTHS